MVVNEEDQMIIDNIEEYINDENKIVRLFSVIIFILVGILAAVMLKTNINDGFIMPAKLKDICRGSLRFTFYILLSYTSVDVFSLSRHREYH